MADLEDAALCDNFMVGNTRLKIASNEKSKRKLGVSANGYQTAYVHGLVVYTKDVFA